MHDARSAEATALGALSRLTSEGVRGVLIGGYAVSSYGLARESADLDLVVEPGQALPAQAILRKEGFGRSKEKKLEGGDYVGSYELWESPTGAKVDLLIGGVQDRRIGVLLPYPYIAAHAALREIAALKSPVTAPCLVASREILVALKLQPFRLVDQRDIFVLCNEPVGAAVLRAHLDRVGSPVPLGNLSRMPEIAAKRAFLDSFKGVYRVAQTRIVDRCTRNLTSLVRDTLSTP